MSSFVEPQSNLVSYPATIMNRCSVKDRLLNMTDNEANDEKEAKIDHKPRVGLHNERHIIKFVSGDEVMESHGSGAGCQRIQ